MVIAAVRYDRTPGGRTPANVAQLYRVSAMISFGSLKTHSTGCVLV